MTFTRALSTNNYGPAKFVVDGTTVANGTHSTIAAALTSASSGDTIFIRPGTYTENITLKSGVSLTAFNCDATTPNVVILGNTTASYNGTASISGICLRTSGSNPCLTISGASTSYLYLDNCEIDALSNTAIVANAANFSFYLNQCSFTSTSNNIYWNITLLVRMTLFQCNTDPKSAGTTGVSTIAAGVIEARGCNLTSPFSTTSSGNFVFNNCYINPNGTAFTTAGTGQSYLINTGIAGAISVGAGTILNMYSCNVNTSTNPAIGGAGTLTYTPIGFPNNSSITTSSTNPAPSSVPMGGTGASTLTGLLTGNGASAVTAITYASSTWSPTVSGSGTVGTATYTAQLGRYVQIGPLIFVSFRIDWNSGTGTGNLLVTNLPVAINSGTGSRTTGELQLNAVGAVIPATTVDLEVVASGPDSTTQLFLQVTNAAGNVANIAYAASGTILGSIWYYTA